MKKNECEDIFKDVQLPGKHECGNTNYKFWLKNKIEYKSKRI